MPRKAKKHPVWSLLVVAVLIFASPYVFLGDGVQCGSDLMSPGDTCFIDGESKTYAERESNQGKGPIITGVIAVLVALAAVGLGLTRPPPSDPEGHDASP